jgi:hypothetical protein
VSLPRLAKITCELSLAVMWSALLMPSQVLLEQLMFAGYRHPTDANSRPLTTLRGLSCSFASCSRLSLARRRKKGEKLPPVA